MHAMKIRSSRDGIVKGLLTLPLHLVETVVLWAIRTWRRRQEAKRPVVTPPKREAKPKRRRPPKVEPVPAPLLALPKPTHPEWPTLH
jgi:hypothetical protein